MRFTSRTWFLLSLMLFLGAIFFWQLGDRSLEKKRLRRERAGTNQASTNSTPPGAKAQTQAGAAYQQPLLTLLPRTNSGPQTPAASSAMTAGAQKISGAKPGSNPNSNRFPLRLSNSQAGLAELMRSDHAILLRNALIDTEVKGGLNIPEHLQSAATRNYIVQSRGTVTAAFRSELANAGAEIVSYIPNNAFLVRVQDESGAKLENLPHTQAVLPYEPYYKLDSRLLPLAVAREALPEAGWLRVTVFPGEKETARQALIQLGAEIGGEDRISFGPQFLVKPLPDTLPALARLDVVQGLETYVPRQLMDDLQRVVLGVATNGSTKSTYLGLTGSNVVVNVNDGGAEADQPELAGRVFVADPNLLNDPEGHGTHVLGTLLGSGIRSSSVKSTPPGSDTNAIFSGIAPKAKAFVFPFKFAPEVTESVSDTFLHEAAVRTNALYFNRTNATLISNNSWGYTGINDYDSSAARFDEAVRDASPDDPGSQPILYVFAAGNSGAGSDNGLNGDPNSITSPGTAKNVITVGATENLRNITNFYLTDTNGVLVTHPSTNGTYITNAPYLGLTDEGTVAAFSSRGNVGIGNEGQFGRFKPDVVAPGTFVIAARSTAFVDQTDTSAPNGDTNAPIFQILGDLDAPLKPYYRYETGTSMAAPAVSGMLALMQEFFEQKLPSGAQRTNSPALMKALLINGARSVSPIYNLQVQNTINYQGWGLVNLTNSIPEVLFQSGMSLSPVQFFDQDPTNALTTGDSRAWSVQLTPEAGQYPLRVTLVWTDPPGNPNAGLKLVNDLDLVVSNTVTHVVYYGNNIPDGSDFTQPSTTETPPMTDQVNNVENVFIRDPDPTNLVVQVVARRVNVNAVSSFGNSSSPTNDITQDFALVISSANTALKGALTLTPFLPSGISTNSNPGSENSTNAPAGTTGANATQTANSSSSGGALPVVVLTNGVPLLNQRVAAQPPSLAAPGDIRQWNFYVFTNVFLTNSTSTLTNGKNVAFITFSPPNLSKPRNSEADIDLYVSSNPALTNLDATAVAESRKSLARGGTESVVLTDAQIGDVFYLAVKAEDQEAAEFGLVAISSNQPFDNDQNGARVIHGFPIQAPIPDGTANTPGAVQIFGIGVRPLTIERVVVTNTIVHENLGDLIGNLSHNGQFVILNNHTLNNGFFEGTNTFVYDDSGRPGGRPTDGPGSLQNFVGMPGNGVWILNMVDNAPTHTGRVESVTIRIDPLDKRDLARAGAQGLDGTVEPGQDRCYFIDVPAEATNLVVKISQLNGSLDVFLKRESMGSQTNYDKFVHLDPPGGEMTLNDHEEPAPLLAGRYFVCLFNPGTAPVDFHIVSQLELGLSADHILTLVSTNSLLLQDDALTRDMFDVSHVDKQVVDVNVGVRIDHPRASDLVLHLVSPQGTRVLLAENRGGASAAGYGGGGATNIIYTTFTDETNKLRNLVLIKFASPPYDNTLFAGNQTNPPVLDDGFDDAALGVYPKGSQISGWIVSNGQVEVHDPNTLNGINPDAGPQFLEFQGSSSVLTNFATVPGRDYLLSFAYHRDPRDVSGAAEAVQVYAGSSTGSGIPDKSITVTNLNWQSTSIVFMAQSAVSAVELSSGSAIGPLIDSVQAVEYTPSNLAFVLPEESLGILRGERTAGDWKLEIEDTHAGPGGSNAAGHLLSWELQIKFAQPRPPAVVLTNGLAFSGVLTNDQTNYFIVDVCPSTTALSAVLQGNTDSLVLMASEHGFPTGDEQRDTFHPIQNEVSFGDQGFATLSLTTNTPLPAPLQPGRRLYLAVRNKFSDETNQFNLTASFDGKDCAVPRSVIRLINDVPYTNAISAGTNLLDYYVFTVPPGSPAVRFELDPQGGDLGLFVKSGLPLPDPITFDYRSDLPGPTNEVIVVSTNSAPVALGPGDWYLGVLNHTTNTVPYTIRASLLPNGNVNVIPLVNGVPVDYTIAAGSAPTNFFSFKATDSPPEIQFGLSNVTDVVDFLIGRDLLPTVTDNFQSNSVAPGAPLVVTLTPGATNLNATWYLAVLSRGSNDLSFTIGASAKPGSPSTNEFVNPTLVVTSSNICLIWPSVPGTTYFLEGKTNIMEPVWEDLRGPIVAVDTTTERCLDRPTPYIFFQVRKGAAATNEPVLINPDMQLSSSNICFTWISIPGSIYHLEGKTNILETRWEDLAGPITAVSTNTQKCVDRLTPFVFFQVRKETNSPSTNQAVFINPDMQLSSTNICFTWISIPGSIYHLEGKTNILETRWEDLAGPITAVSTNTEKCVDRSKPYVFFQVRKETNSPSTNQAVFINPEMQLSSSTICFTWSSTPGLTYHLEGRTNLLESRWEDLSGPIIAVSTNTEQCVPRSTPYVFFQVRSDVVLQTNKPVFIDPSLAVSSNKICFTWASTVGATYFLQGKTNLNETNWINASPALVASSNSITHCLDLPTGFRFFQVEQAGLGTNGTNTGGQTNSSSGSTNGVQLLSPKIFADGRVRLEWTNTVAGKTYRVDFSTNLLSANPWHFWTNITATSGSVVVTNTPSGGGSVRFYRIVVP